LSMLGKHCTTELYSSPVHVLYSVSEWKIGVEYEDGKCW
jgi:hypothetical protein